MLKPEQNKIMYQDLETTRERLNDSGIFVAQDLNYFDMPLIAKIAGAGVLITGKIMVNDKKVKTYSSDYNTSSDEYDTKVLFRINDKNGNKVIDEARRPFLATTRNNYITALNYLLKRTPYYQK